MRFIEAEGILSKNGNEWLDVGEGDYRKERALSRKISEISEEFNAGIAGEEYAFCIRTNEQSALIGVLCCEVNPPEKLVGSFLDALGLKWEHCYLKEVTFEHFQHILHIADSENYINSYDQVLERFGLDCLQNRRMRGFEFGENLIKDAKKEAVYQKASTYHADDTFLPELDRIYAGRSKSKATGHPVHYMIETDDRDIRRELGRRLLEALYANGRLMNRRYVFVDFNADDVVNPVIYDCIYKSCIGGAVIVRFLGNEDAEDDHASSGREIIEILCNTMKRYRKDVLTLFCLPRECTETKELFYEYLGNTVFVELKEDFVSGERAETILKAFAKESGLRADKKLLEIAADGNEHLSTELKARFDEWYYEKLKTKVYPQYMSQTAVQREIKEAPPKGSAYDELMQMIGLSEAKHVINQALSFYKAQKLFKDQGLPVDHPSMHMVFTGNPGTAKTSAARLFASIMRDNGLLSKGRLIEVGRSDLVGKYVGWTAKIVKKKFQEAMGSVLFIDEAYSLCDDRDGSYGDEAINTIVQEMENHRSDVVVIFAGYPDKMEKFLEKNPGLRSRIAFHVPFSDYSAEELVRISCLIAKKSGLSVERDAEKKMEEIFAAARTAADFGNGRFARNMIEKARMNQAARLLEMDLSHVKKEDLLTLCEVDFEAPEELKKAEVKRIGFCA